MAVNKTGRLEICSKFEVWGASELSAAINSVSGAAHMGLGGTWPPLFVGVT